MASGCSSIDQQNTGDTAQDSSNEQRNAMQRKMTSSKSIRKLCTSARLLADKDKDRKLVSLVMKPWMGKENEWTKSRLFAAKIVHAREFEIVMTCIIIFNLGTIIYETDNNARCYPQYADSLGDCPYESRKVIWLQITNKVLLGCYTLEAIFRAYADRLKYIHSRWNQLDLLVILTGWLSEVAGSSLNLAFLRMVRLARLSRAFHILLGVRELYLLLNGIMSSMRAIFFGSILLFVMLVGYSIVLVEAVHPLNSKIIYSTCSECTQGFRSVWFSVLTLYKQIVAGDAWILSFPLMEGRVWIALLMLLIVSTVTLGVMNLILTVIVERATDAREQDIQDKARHKAADQFESKQKLMKICADMDLDRSGMVSLKELLIAYDDSTEFRNFLTTMEIHRDDLETTFKLLDVDQSGDLDYEEFCEELIQLESHDQRLSMAMVRFSVNQIRQMLERSVQTKLVDVLAILQQQANLIERLDTKIESRVFTVDHVPQTKFPSPKPLQSRDMQLCSEELPGVLTGLAGLHQEMQSLAIVQADTLREVEGQVSALLCQADLASSYCEFLSQGRSTTTGKFTGSTVSLDSSMPNEEFTKLGALVSQLQATIQQTMSKSIQEVQKNSKCVEKTLTVSGSFLQEIQQLLPQAFHDNELRGAIDRILDAKGGQVSRM